MLSLKMKVVATTILVAMALAGSAYAQPEQPSKVVEANRKTNIIIGTTNLSLGMPKDFVVSALAAQFDLKSEYPGCDSMPQCRRYNIFIPGKAFLVGSLQFNKQRSLIAVSKNWTLEPRHYSDGEIGKALVALLSSLVAEGNDHCSLKASYSDYLDARTDKPDGDTLRVATLECQSKRVNIQAERYKGDNFMEIFEEIGTWEH